LVTLKLDYKDSHRAAPFPAIGKKDEAEKIRDAKNKIRPRIAKVGSKVLGKSWQLPTLQIVETTRKAVFREILWQMANKWIKRSVLRMVV
jgi:hypothetical protein